MNERKLKIFYEVAKHLNMTQVANKFYISQPAVSQTIHEIENEFNVKFFDRINKKLYLTKEGAIFLNYVRRILNIYDEARETIKGFNDLECGILKIGASTTIGIYILPKIIGDFHKNHKGVDTAISIENTKIIVDMILQNKVDFAFVEGPVYDDEIIKSEFCSDELVFIVSPFHKWSKKRYINLEDIAYQKIIMREKGSGTREIFESYMTTNQVSYNIAFELGNTEAIKKAVEAGMGISCISKRCVLNEVKENRLCIVKIKNLVIKRKLILIYHKDKFLSKLIRLFIEFAQSEIKK